MRPDLSSPKSLVLRLLMLLMCALSPSLSLAIEEPEYTVIRKIDKVELRQYAPYVVAEVVLKSSADAAGNQAFPILAGYIFGKNKGAQTFAMTAPVTQQSASSAPATEPMRMAMTAPVTQQSAADGGMRVQFVLPKSVTLASAPEPLDSRVQLRQIEAAQWAVLRYSGTWSQANYAEHLSILRATLSQAGITTQGEPLLARYNGPITPWFMRRNEVWLALP
ncbi:SOUL family heme-binding protein [Roseateles sp.]|uniref:SOUL family heme-binding protein n=1 Tax=Roseateles sp. TaxID=1971397 RepID=UPI003BA45D83